MEQPPNKENETKTEDTPPVASPPVVEKKENNPFSALFDNDDSKAFKEERASKPREQVHKKLEQGEQEEAPQYDDYDPEEEEEEEEPAPRRRGDAIVPTDFDYQQAKMLLMFWEKGTSTIASFTAYGDWTHSKEFRVIGNLYDESEEKEYRDLVEAAATVNAKYGFKMAAEIVLGFGLTGNLGMKMKKASDLRKAIEAASAAGVPPNPANTAAQPTKQQTAVKLL